MIAGVLMGKSDGSILRQGNGEVTAVQLGWG